MTNQDTYNGWTNYETWNWKLWMDNDEGTQEYWASEAERVIENTQDTSAEFAWISATSDLAKQLKTECEDWLESWMPEQAGPFADILNAAVNLIDWHEIADSLLDEVDEVE
jgi:hypothetical protein